MTPRTFRLWTIAVVAFTANAASACPACAMQPNVPGMLQVDPRFALPATLFAALLLRPFLSRAGLAASSVAVASARAAVLGTAIGFAALTCLVLSWIPFGPGMFLLSLVAVFCAEAMTVAGYCERVRWRWLLLGHATVFVTLWLTGILADTLLRLLPQAAATADGFWSTVSGWLAGLSILALAALSLRRPAEAGRDADPATRFAASGV